MLSVAALFVAKHEGEKAYKKKIDKQVIFPLYASSRSFRISGKSMKSEKLLMIKMHREGCFCVMQ